MWLWVRGLLGEGGLEVPGRGSGGSRLRGTPGVELQGRVPQTPSPWPAPPTSDERPTESSDGSLKV